MVILNASHRGFRSKVLNIFGLVVLLANVYTSCHEDGILSTDGSGEDGTTSKDGQFYFHQLLSQNRCNPQQIEP
ncbi:unnamed protein product [Prunus armeniaca]|uniref:Uncharacterized protein n=1 Tax=Prunus armeniaca TaxID=36596 RepID=A0A6J5X6T1_PRUAR|nr:unnamed protein product [Prunus armeniaca]CAB4308303.1 unnamed protein product [Prunus armeniaca]